MAASALKNSAIHRAFAAGKQIAFGNLRDKFIPGFVVTTLCLVGIFNGGGYVANHAMTNDNIEREAGLAMKYGFKCAAPAKGQRFTFEALDFNKPYFHLLRGEAKPIYGTVTIDGMTKRPPDIIVQKGVDLEKDFKNVSDRIPIRLTGTTGEGRVVTVDTDWGKDQCGHFPQP